VETVELATYGHSVELLTLTGLQCFGLAVVDSNDYLLLLMLSNLKTFDRAQQSVSVNQSCYDDTQPS